ncbi:MAG: DUF2357 domain-containing protein [Syntrophobacteraceae bacterium]
MPIDVQLHFWPWSRGTEETVSLTSREVSFPFWGSPVVSISSRAVLHLPRRHERFTPFGPSFDTIAGEYRLYETPHGVLAAGNAKNQVAGAEVRVSIDGLRGTVRLNPYGAKPRFSQDKEKRGEDSLLARTVVAWSQFFDDLLDDAKKSRRENKLSWAEAIKIIFDISEDPKQPRKALIVDIAEQMRSRIADIVATARRILSRERVLLPAGSISETDTACLRWLVRQPGDDLAQKAATNRQRLLGISRHESFDTLENKVLKDFLKRCSTEGRRYLKSEVGENPGFLQSQRAITVRQYQYLCSDLFRTPHFEKISAPPPAPRPNYVLQNDLRYREVWQHYIRLLKREDEEDCLWDWQTRTWADVSRFLVCAALYGLSQETSSKVVVKELLWSALNLTNEQRLGCRIPAGSEPGPFLVSIRGAETTRACVLEIVHPDQAGDHPATKLLGRTGGHLYLVLSPLTGGRRLVLVVWAVHTAASEDHPTWTEIGKSAGRGLIAHSHVLNELGDPDFPILRGFVVGSDMESAAADLHPGAGDDLHLVQVATDQRCWDDALKGIILVIEDILEEAL